MVWKVEGLSEYDARRPLHADRHQPARAGQAPGQRRAGLLRRHVRPAAAGSRCRGTPTTPTRTTTCTSPPTSAASGCVGPLPDRPGRTPRVTFEACDLDDDRARCRGGGDRGEVHAPPDPGPHGRPRPHRHAGHADIVRETDRRPGRPEARRRATSRTATTGRCCVATSHGCRARTHPGRGDRDGGSAERSDRAGRRRRPPPSHRAGADLRADRVQTRWPRSAPTGRVSAREAPKETLVEYLGPPGTRWSGRSRGERVLARDGRSAAGTNLLGLVKHLASVGSATSGTTLRPARAASRRLGTRRRRQNDDSTSRADGSRGWVRITTAWAPPADLRGVRPRDVERVPWARPGRVTLHQSWSTRPRPPARGRTPTSGTLSPVVAYLTMSDVAPRLWRQSREARPGRNSGSASPD